MVKYSWIWYHGNMKILCQNIMKSSHSLCSFRCILYLSLEKGTRRIRKFLILTTAVWINLLLQVWCMQFLLMRVEMKCERRILQMRGWIIWIRMVKRTLKESNLPNTNTSQVPSWRYMKLDGLMMEDSITTLSKISFGIWRRMTYFGIIYLY